jgi:hypothetical protein
VGGGGLCGLVVGGGPYPFAPAVALVAPPGFPPGDAKAPSMTGSASSASRSGIATAIRDSQDARRMCAINVRSMVTTLFLPWRPAVAIVEVIRTCRKELFAPFLVRYAYQMAESQKPDAVSFAR